MFNINRLMPSSWQLNDDSRPLSVFCLVCVNEEAPIPVTRMKRFCILGCPSPHILAAPPNIPAITVFLQLLVHQLHYPLSARRLGTGAPQHSPSACALWTLAEHVQAFMALPHGCSSSSISSDVPGIRSRSIPSPRPISFSLLLLSGIATLSRRERYRAAALLSMHFG